MNYGSSYVGRARLKTVLSGQVVNQAVSGSGGSFNIALGSTIDLSRSEFHFNGNGQSVIEGTNGLPQGFGVMLFATYAQVWVYGGGPAPSLSQMRWRVEQHASKPRNIARGISAAAASTTRTIAMPIVDPTRVAFRILGTWRAAGSIPLTYCPEKHVVANVTTSGFDVLLPAANMGFAWEATERF